MLPIKNNNLKDKRIVTTETINMEDKFNSFLLAINCKGDEGNNFIYRIYFTSLLNALFRDNCYYATSLINEMHDLDNYLESVKELNVLPFIRNNYSRNDKNYLLSKIEIIEGFFIDHSTKLQKKTFLDWLETMCLFVTEKITYQEYILYPIFMEWNLFNLTIGYTSENQAYNKVLLPTPEYYSLFVTTYYNGDFNESVPNNILVMSLDELGNIVYGEPIDDILKRVMDKILETIELDKFDPIRSMYYISINAEEFSKELYMSILSLMQHFNNFITSLRLSDNELHISNVNKKNMTINYRGIPIK